MISPAMPVATTQRTSHDGADEGALTMHSAVKGATPRSFHSCVCFAVRCAVL